MFVLIPADRGDISAKAWHRICSSSGGERMCALRFSSVDPGTRACGSRSVVNGFSVCPSPGLCWAGLATHVNTNFLFLGPPPFHPFFPLLWLVREGGKSQAWFRHVNSSVTALMAAFPPKILDGGALLLLLLLAFQRGVLTPQTGQWWGTWISCFPSSNSPLIFHLFKPQKERKKIN